MFPCKYQKKDIYHFYNTALIHSFIHNLWYHLVVLEHLNILHNDDTSPSPAQFSAIITIAGSLKVLSWCVYDNRTGVNSFFPSPTFEDFLFFWGLRGAVNSEGCLKYGRGHKWKRCQCFNGSWLTCTFLFGEQQLLKSLTAFFRMTRTFFEIMFM